tara:strand:+ start:3719 stop:4594 length:876 start_codon:yes stop_codon:yes gene_type:complete
MDSGGLVGVSVVLLTMGDRSDSLDKAIGSIHLQKDCITEIILVWNGSKADHDVSVDRHITLDSNIGIPAGRNLGAAEASHDLILFLDDDAKILKPDLLENIGARFLANPSLGVVGFRIIDEQGLTSRRHVPRLGSRSADVSGAAACFLGGACVVRKDAWNGVKGYSGELFYGMEETDFSWRLVDAGWSIFYDASAIVEHPRVEPARHQEAIRLTARNRMWIARSNLPTILIPVYVFNWLVISILRNLRSIDALRAIFTGFRQGLSECPLQRRPISWRTVITLCRIGRPPVI